MKATRRWIIALLAIVMALSMIACDSEKAPESTSGSTEQVTTQPNETVAITEAVTQPEVKYDENGYLLDDLPDTLDFENESVTVLMWKEWVRYDFVVDENATEWSQELLERQYEVEDRLNVSLKIEVEKGNWDNRAGFLAKVENDQMAFDKSSFDLIGTYTPTMANLATHGYMTNLNEVEYLTLDKPWWNQQQIEASTINGNLYFLTGDITPTTLMTMWCVYGNESLLNSYGYTDLYEWVNNGEWTLEKMMQTALHNVENNGGKVDTYGIVIAPSAQDILAHGAGIFYIGRNDKNLYKFDDSLTNEKTPTFFALLQDLHHNYDNVEYDADSKIFCQGKSFFHIGQVGNMLNLKETDIEFIVLPMPKYDTAQTEYYTTTGAWNTLFGLPTKVRAADMSGAILEALASESHRSVIPVVFEECFTTRFVADPEDSAMVRLVYNSLVYDPAHMYAEAFGTLPSSFKQVVDPTTSWTNIWNTHSASWLLKIATINNTLK